METNFPDIKKLAEKVGRHPTTVFRWLNRTRRISPEDAALLEKATGIPRLSWLYPDEFNNPMMRGDDKRSA
jgi:DNA-binding transcriptional regulator YdaS (Cro superfamily)